MVKNPLWFLFIFLSIIACKDRPEFPSTPVISLNDYYFREIQGISLDSLIIKIRFQDGDGDLGLESFETYPPYHLYDVVKNQSGDTVRHGDPGAPPYDCVNYEILRKETSVNDTLVITADTIQIERNPNHFNFFLTFLIDTTGNGDFREFNPALERNCAPPYHGRYFVLNTARDIRPLEGELQYSLVSGFRLLFRNETIKLRIMIQDRTLHQSNTIETDPINILEIIRPPL